MLALLLQKSWNKTFLCKYTGKSVTSDSIDMSQLKKVSYKNDFHP